MAREPTIKWDGKQFQVSLPVDGGKALEAKWTATTVYVMRVREVGSDDWSPGFVTPLSGATLENLKPDTEYEFELGAINVQTGERGPLNRTRARTGKRGQPDNVLPFPGPPRS